MMIADNEQTTTQQGSTEAAKALASELEAAQETRITLDLSTPEITAELAEAPIFAKKGMVEARQVTEVEEIKTVLADGTHETTNTAQPGDFIVTNPAGEMYVLKPDDFAKRYEKTDQDGVYKATGIIRAIPNPTGEDISVTAPWGEVQNGGPDCMIATIYGPSNPDEISMDRYIIAGAEFEQTYGTYQEVYGTPAP